MTRVRTARTAPSYERDDDYDFERRLPPPGSMPVRVVEAALRNPAVAGGALLSGLAIIAIFVNALANQPQRHPSPMFHTRVVAETAQVLPSAPGAAVVAAATPAPVQVTTTAISVDPVASALADANATRPAAPIPAVPARRPAEPAVAPPSINSTQIIERVQQGLKDRGLYTGTVDGISGPATADAIRVFERSQGLSPSGEATERLANLLKSEKPRVAVVQPKLQPMPPPVTQAVSPVPPEPLTGTIEGRMQRVQRALNAGGYGQLRTDGRFDDKTSDAIKRYESDHGLPVTGMLSERLVLGLLSSKTAQAR